MAKCPDCLKEVGNYSKKWKYSCFDVEVYSCDCGTNFRSYKKHGSERFQLIRRKGEKRFHKP